VVGIGAVEGVLGGTGAGYVCVGSAGVLGPEPVMSPPDTPPRTDAPTTAMLASTVNSRRMGLRLRIGTVSAATA
jgi:hypothetical protein